MSSTDRRRFLKQLLGTLAAAGSGVVASASTGQAEGPTAEPQPDTAGDIQQRADHIAEATGAAEQDVTLAGFLNGGFRNGIGGGFRNGGFANGLGGGFRNGGFRNGVGGGFRNGAFRNW